MSEPLKKWIDPKYAHVVDYVDDLRALREGEGSMANCSNCGGSGRHIYNDPKSGKTKSITCSACQGSGQK